MASPRRIPSVPAGSGNKENISQDGDAPLDFATLPKEGSASTRWKKKPAGFNLRKSIAWNPAFFTEEGVLDNSELSVLTGSQPMANRSLGSGVSSIMSPSCQSGRYGNTYVLKEAAENSHGKLPARYHRAESQGRKLFSSAKTPQRDKQKEPAGTQNRNSARSIQICSPRVPAGSIQKKVPNSSASTAQMSRIPKQSRPSLPKVPKSTSSATNSLESHKKIAPVKAELVHRVTGLPTRLKINSVSSGPSIEKDAVPAVTGVREEASASVKCKKIPAHPQISPSSPFDSAASKFAKPSALRMPSSSVGFFNQEKALVSHGDAAKRNMGRCFSSNTSALDKPPRYRQSEESRPHLTKQLSTNCTAASNLVPSVTRESNLKSLVIPEKESLSKVITTYIEKPGNVNNQARPKADFSLAGTGATTTPQPMNLEKNDDAGNSVPLPVVYNGTSHIEGRGSIREIEPLDNSYSLEAICSSTIEPVEDSFPLQASYSSTKPIVGSKLSPSCISSEVCSSSELSCQGKSDSDSSAAIDLENSNVGETALGAFLLKDQLPHCGSLRDETPTLADSHSDLNDSLCDEAKPALSEEPNTEGEMELETNSTLDVKATPLLDVGCGLIHNYRTTDCSPMKLEASTPCVERRHALLVEPNIEEKMVLDTDRLSAIQDAPHIEKNKAPDRSPANTILKDHLKNLVPFTEEWLAVMEARGQEVLEQKTGAVQNSPPDNTAPEPSPWSPVKRKAQDVGPFDCTKFSKNIRTSGT
ncbi:probable GPI-anchored adhesin-like protein PGA55 isoform X2 [Miscanthus floridulus]|uniref:probable GPI-anchored adhesin-like protein PGA55 isoform X2 n=1 Tax=Miscanthus floridulus TaxID=154761 RepID=UPI00345AE99E